MEKFTLQEMDSWEGVCDKPRYSNLISYFKSIGKEECTIKDLLECPYVTSLFDLVYFINHKKELDTGDFRVPCISILQSVCDDFYHPTLIALLNNIKSKNNCSYLVNELTELGQILDKGRASAIPYLHYLASGIFSLNILAHVSRFTKHFFKENKDEEHKRVLLSYLNVKN